ncbi:MAG: HAD family hydrolase [Chloroflexi bacterium]|nr:HAD family hydrolase [Chloroflexota bacterium]
MLLSRISKPAAITFDLWQTLIFEGDGSARSRQRRELRSESTVDALSGRGQSVDREAVNGAFMELGEQIAAGHDRGLDSYFDVWIERLIERLDPGMADRIGATGLEAVGRVIDQAFTDSPPQLLEGSLELLDALSARGLKMGLISNTGLTSLGTYEQWFRKIGLLGRLDHISLSTDLALAKPAKTIFDLTLNALGVLPARALHVGDNMHTDVAGAEAAGMSTVWVRGGFASPVNTSQDPDYAVDSVLELMPVVEQWLETLYD